MTNIINICVLGASGYTGVELLRHLAQHPLANIVALTGESQAGKEVGDVYPHLAHAGLPKLIKINDVDFTDINIVFCCLPHATTQKVIAALPEHVRIIDLSADFRLHDVRAYEEWYGGSHHAPELQNSAVYGLAEHARAAIKEARLVANPGCYPTSVLLPLIPLLHDKLLANEGIIVDSMSGVSGAGRNAKQQLLFCEVNTGAAAYGVGGHRHVAEIEQELAKAAGTPVHISFTPHLVPMNRGISSTIHVKLNENITVQDMYKCLQEKYINEPFVHILPCGTTPKTQDVRGSNCCHIGMVKDRVAGQVILVSVIDNLVKGASGQAIQNMNIMLGLDEMTGLKSYAMFP